MAMDAPCLSLDPGQRSGQTSKVEEWDRFCSTTPCDYAPPMMPLQEFPQLSDSGVELLNRLLTFDPEKRITARQALRHSYFTGAQRSSLICCMLARRSWPSCLHLPLCSPKH